MEILVQAAPGWEHLMGPLGPDPHYSLCCCKAQPEGSGARSSDRPEGASWLAAQIRDHLEDQLVPGGQGVIVRIRAASQPLAQCPHEAGTQETGYPGH